MWKGPRGQTRYIRKPTRFIHDLAALGFGERHEILVNNNLSASRTRKDDQIATLESTLLHEVPVYIGREMDREHTFRDFSTQFCKPHPQRRRTSSCRPRPPDVADETLSDVSNSQPPLCKVVTCSVNFERIESRFQRESSILSSPR